MTDSRFADRTLIPNSTDSRCSKSGGKFTKAQGQVEETIGNLTGATSWKTSGQQKQASGEAEYKTAQTEGYAEGTKDRAGGKVDQVVGSVTGDKSKEAAGTHLSPVEDALV